MTRLLLMLLLALPPAAAWAQPVTSPASTVCDKNKNECPRGNAVLTRTQLPVPPSGVDAQGRAYNHRGVIVYVSDCLDQTCAAGGGSTKCALRGTDDGTDWQVVVCGGTGSGSGAPSGVRYWVGAADGTLTNEHNLGGVSTGLVLNTSGTPTAYAGTSCPVGQAIRSLNASGAQNACTTAGTVTFEESDGGAQSGITTVDLGAGFDFTVSPAGEVNLALDTSELGNVTIGDNSAGWTWTWQTGNDPDPAIGFADTGIIINPAVADLDFEVRGVGAGNLLFADASANCVGIGSTCAASGRRAVVSGTLQVDGFACTGAGGGSCPGGSGSGTPGAAGFRPFGAPGAGSIGPFTNDQCEAWQAPSPYQDAQGIPTMALEVTVSDANDIVRLGVYNAAGTSLEYNAPVTVSAVGYWSGANSIALTPFTATDHWFVLCFDSPDALVTSRFRSSGVGPSYGKQVIFANGTNNAVLPTTISGSIPGDAWTTSAEPPAMVVRLE